MFGRLLRAPSRVREMVRLIDVRSRFEAQRAHEALEALKREPRYAHPKHLARFGYKVYSQNDEDGIIAEIFERVGAVSRTFVEFGVGDGLENNTLTLLFKGWRGLWIEGNPRFVERIRTSLPVTIASGAVRVTNAFVTRENIDELISAALGEREIDLLSIDIDGNDFHVFDAITCVVPRVVVIEYNAKFPPPMIYCMDYDERHAWSGDDNFGASLKFLEQGFARRGYRLVGCNLTGSNAFFVRADLVGSKFLEPFSAENHYEPARYHLTGFPSGHRPSFRTLENSVAARVAAYGDRPR